VTVADFLMVKIFISSCIVKGIEGFVLGVQSFYCAVDC